MASIKDFQMGNGSVTFRSEIEPTPETRETSKQGSVVVNTINSATQGVPAYYEVSFMLNTTIEHDGVVASNIFHWTCLVSEKSDRAQYRSVEDQAARQIAPMLRSLADKIEASLPDFQEK
jgi:hypothetical protein